MQASEAPPPDPDVAPGDRDTNGAIGYAASAASLVTLTTSSFGADGPAGGDAATATTYALKVTDDTFSGVKATDGTNIYLYDDGNGVILGRLGDDSDATADQPNASGDVVFALAIDSDTGEVYIAQWSSLLQTNTSDDDEPVALANDALEVEVTITDGDGDTDTDTAFVGNQIIFEDDAPSQDGGTTELLVHEDALDNFDPAFVAPGTEGSTGNRENPSQITFTYITAAALLGLVDFGTDGAGAFELNLSLSGTTGLTSQTQAINWANVGATLEGQSTDGRTIFGVEEVAQGSAEYSRGRYRCCHF